MDESIFTIKRVVAGVVGVVCSAFASSAFAARGIGNVGLLIGVSGEGVVDNPVSAREIEVQILAIVFGFVRDIESRHPHPCETGRGVRRFRIDLGDRRPGVDRLDLDPRTRSVLTIDAEHAVFICRRGGVAVDGDRDGVHNETRFFRPRRPDLLVDLGRVVELRDQGVPVNVNDVRSARAKNLALQCPSARKGRVVLPDFDGIRVPDHGLIAVHCNERTEVRVGHFGACESGEDLAQREGMVRIDLIREHHARIDAHGLRL